MGAASPAATEGLHGGPEFGRNHVLMEVDLKRAVGLVQGHGLPHSGHGHGALRSFDVLGKGAVGRSHVPVDHEARGFDYQVSGSRESPFEVSGDGFAAVSCRACGGLTVGA